MKSVKGLIMLVMVVIGSAVYGAEQADPFRDAVKLADRLHLPLIVHERGPNCPACDIVDACYSTDMRARGVYLKLDAVFQRQYLERIPGWRPGLYPRVYYWQRGPHGELLVPRVFIGVGGIRVFVGR